MNYENSTVGQLAAEVPASIRIFEEWRIDYCCGGATPLTDACAAAGKTVGEFLAALKAAAVAPSAARDWSSQSLEAIASHLVDAYHRYTREELQTLLTLSKKVLGVHGERHSELTGVLAAVIDLGNDMLPHMMKEEQVLFPFVQRLEQSIEDGTPPPTPFFATVKNPIHMMMMEHERVGEILAHLRSLTGGYETPADACFSYRELYRRLAEFEAKTHEHVHIENNVYFPRAVELEERTAVEV
jgi:regulator of cell morphogenesis and NO signaling